MWPFRRRKKYEVVNRIIDVPLPILIRQVIYDSIYSSSEEIAKIMGLPPISDEVQRMEQQASEDRLAKFSALMPFIDAQADISAQVSASAYLLEAKVEDHESEHVEELIKLFKLISLSASVSCISTLMNLGLLDTEVISDDDE